MGNIRNIDKSRSVLEHTLQTAFTGEWRGMIIDLVEEVQKLRAAAKDVSVAHVSWGDQEQAYGQDTLEAKKSDWVTDGSEDPEIVALKAKDRELDEIISKLDDSDESIVAASEYGLIGLAKLEQRHPSTAYRIRHYIHNVHSIRASIEEQLAYKPQEGLASVVGMPIDTISTPAVAVANKKKTLLDKVLGNK